MGKYMGEPSTMEMGGASVSGGEGVTGSRMKYLVNLVMPLSVAATGSQSFGVP